MSLIWSHQNKIIIIARLAREMKIYKKKNPVNRKKRNSFLICEFKHLLFLLSSIHITLLSSSSYAAKRNLLSVLFAFFILLLISFFFLLFCWWFVKRRKQFSYQQTRVYANFLLKTQRKLALNFFFHKKWKIK